MVVETAEQFPLPGLMERTVTQALLEPPLLDLDLILPEARAETAAPKAMAGPAALMGALGLVVVGLPRLLFTIEAAPDRVDVGLVLERCGNLLFVVVAVAVVLALLIMGLVQIVSLAVVAGLRAGVAEEAAEVLNHVGRPVLHVVLQVRP